MRTQKSLAILGVLSTVMTLGLPAFAAGPRDAAPSNRNGSAQQQQQPKDRQLQIGPVRLMQEKVKVDGAAATKTVRTGISVKGLGRFTFGSYEKGEVTGTNAAPGKQPTRLLVNGEKGVHVQIGPKTIKLPLSRDQRVVNVPLPFGFQPPPPKAPAATAEKPAAPQAKAPSSS